MEWMAWACLFVKPALRDDSGYHDRNNVLLGYASLSWYCNCKIDHKPCTTGDTIYAVFMQCEKNNSTQYISFMYKPCKLVGYISYRIIYHISYIIIYHIISYIMFNPRLAIQPFPSRPPLVQLMDPALLFRMRVLLKEACHAEVPHPGREDCLVQYQQIYEILCKNNWYLLRMYQL